MAHINTATASAAVEIIDIPGLGLVSLDSDIAALFAEVDAILRAAGPSICRDAMAGPARPIRADQRGPPKPATGNPSESNSHGRRQ